MIFRVIALLYMAVNTVTDARRKEIDIRFTVAAGILLVLLRVFGFSRDWKLTLLNFVPCAVLFAANRLSPGAVGTGDVLVAGMLGFLLPGTELMRCMILGFWLAGGWGLIRKVWKHGGQEAEIPLVPFVLLAYVMGYCL